MGSPGIGTSRPSGKASKNTASSPKPARRAATRSSGTPAEFTRRSPPASEISTYGPVATRNVATAGNPPGDSARMAWSPSGASAAISTDTAAPVTGTSAAVPSAEYSVIEPPGPAKPLTVTRSPGATTGGSADSDSVERSDSSFRKAATSSGRSSISSVPRPVSEGALVAVPCSVAPVHAAAASDIASHNTPNLRNRIPPVIDPNRARRAEPKRPIA